MVREQIRTALFFGISSVLSLSIVKMLGFIKISWAVVFLSFIIGPIAIYAAILVLLAITFFAIKVTAQTGSVKGYIKTTDGKPAAVVS